MQFSYRDLAIFCEQISMMIQSGIMLHSGMQMIADDTSNTRKRTIYQHVSDHLAEGEMLHNALKSTDAFPDYMISMTEIGARSGKLESVMNALAAYYDRQHAMRENIKSAVFYPLILITMMLMVLIFLSAKVLPVFEQVFKSLGTQLSPGAAYIMKAGAMFNNYSVLLAMILITLAFAGFFFSRTESGKALLPILLMGKKISEKFSLAAFTSSMALMLSSGLDLDLSIQLSEKAVSNKAIEEKIRKARTIMETQPVSIVDAMQHADLFSSTMTGLLSTGYQSGALDTAMEYIAGLYEEEYESALMRKVSLIEPVSIFVLSVLIGSILVSVMFPLLGVLSTIG
ncbi:type II secretion system F family protein [Anoxybacterium hadale]|uniref:Type II secretion system F family protein n=1 Tax=Anoxybacterium hadale TaxID=3408580 RepID=A0ACD1AAE7_9FIRM|nr:type II secretion system F family protein [Clostridiales bacterium]